MYLQEFKEFLTKTNALALAVGVIIGAATGKVVSGIVEDLLMPVVGVVLPSGDWQQAQVVLSRSTDAAGKVTVNAIKYGHFIGVIIDFIIVAYVVFLITKLLLPKEPAKPTEATKQCPECLETVPAAAKKCRACASALPS